MLYDPDSRTLTLERVDCRTCRSTRSDVPQGTRAVFATIPCPKCKGTGRRGNGQCRECKPYTFQPGRPAGQVIDYQTVAALEPCPTCDGHPISAGLENFTDNAPPEAIAALPLNVVRQERGNSWNESHLALGCLWSCTDYGRANGMTDAQVAQSIRDDKALQRVQACKVVAPYQRGDTSARLADSLAIIVTRNGYSVRAAWAGDSTVTNAARELDPDTAMVVGMAVYAAGGNGTMAAATARREG